MITQIKLHALLHYNDLTGLFYYRKDTHMHKAGGQAGKTTNHGYIRIYIDGGAYLAHRLAWLYMHGEFPKNDTDHINGITTDNRISNIRPVTKAENLRNKKLYASNKSGVHGVRWEDSRNKWRARICIDKHMICLGRFEFKWDAICARKSSEIKNGYHHNHGRIT